MRYHKGLPIKRYMIKEINTGITFKGEAKECAKFIKETYPERIKGYFSYVAKAIRDASKIKSRTAYGFKVEDLTIDIKNNILVLLQEKREYLVINNKYQSGMYNILIHPSDFLKLAKEIPSGFGITDDGLYYYEDFLFYRSTDVKVGEILHIPEFL